MGPNGIKVKTKKPEHFILHTHDTYSSSGMSLCVVLFLTLISKSSQFSNFQMSVSPLAIKLWDNTNEPPSESASLPFTPLSTREITGKQTARSSPTLFYKWTAGFT